MASRPVDEKIVAMKMDNSDFKNKAIETTGLFGKLTDALNKIPGVNLGKVTQSFGEIQNAVGKIDMGGLANNIESISSRFSNLGVVATTALATIANKVTNLGLSFAKSLTVQPLMDGFNEYEQKMNSIQTMLSNTEWEGSTLKDVKRVLGTLNDYADNTIYDFGQMTRSIGTWTAAGVGLNDSATAIKGLGNLAAVSGSSVDQLNTAMYQMSQGMAAGKFGAIDWMSMTNAGMGGKKTQDALMATAKAMGKNIDMANGFKGSLEQGWLTADVFLTTMKQFGNDESMTKAATSVRTFTGFIGALKESIGSGWATTWELIFGDFDEATKRWTGISEAVGGFFKMFDNGRNSIVKSMADAGIFNGLFNIFINSGKAVLSIFQAIGKGIKNAFSGTKIGLIDAIGKGINKFADSLIPSKKTLTQITIIFQALFSVVNIVVKVLVGLGKILFAVVAVPLKLIMWIIDGLVTGFLNVTSWVGKLVIAFTEGIKSGKNLYSSLGGLQGIFSAIGSVIGKAVQHVSSFVNAIKEAWRILTTGEVSKNGPWANDSTIVGKLLRIRDAVLWFNDAIQESWKILTTGNVSKNGPWAEDSKIVFKLLSIREAVIDFARTIEQAYKIIATGKYVEGPLLESDKLVGRLLKLREAALDFARGMEEAYSILAKGKFTGKGPWEEDSKIVKALFKIRESALDMANGIVEAWNILAKGNYTGVGPWSKDSNMVKSLFKIRDAVKSLVDWMGTASSDLSIEPIVAGFEKLLGIMKDGPWNSDNMASWLSKIGDGIKNLTSHLGDLNFSLDPIVNGFKSFFSGIRDGFDWIIEKSSAAWTAIKKFFSGIEGSDVFAGGFIAGLVAIVGMALKMAWDMYQVFTGWGKIGKGVTDVLEGVSGALEGFSRAMTANAVATTVISVAIAVGILALSLKLLSTIKPEKVGTSLTALVTILTGLIGAMAIMSKYDITGTGMKSALQMVGMAAAIYMIAGALKKLSNLKPEETTKGLYGLFGIMISLSGAFVLMSKFGGTQVTASALQIVAIAASVLLLVSAIKKIANVDPADLNKGLVTIGWILLEIAAFLKVADKTRFGIGSTLGMLAIGKAIMNITDAIKEIAKINPQQLKDGLKTIAIILTEIAVFSALTAGNGLLTSGIGILLISAALTALLIPITILGNMNLKTLAIGLGAIAVALITIGAASMLMTGMIAAGAGLILIAVGLTMLVGPIGLLGNMKWEHIKTGIYGVALGILLIGGAAAILGLASAPLLMGAAAIALLGIALLAAGAGMSLFSTGLVALAAMTGAAITTIVATLGTLIMGLASLIPMAVDFVIKVIMQMATAVMDKAPILISKFLDMVIKVLNVIADHTPDFLDAATRVITSFLDGLSRNMPKIVESATNLILTFIDTLATSIDQNGPKFIAAVMRLMGAVMLVVVQAGVAMITALFGWIPGVKTAASEIGKTAENYIRDNFMAGEVGTAKGTEFATGLGSTATQANNAGLAVGNAGKDGTNGVNLLNIGASKGLDFANGMLGKTNDANTAGLAVGNAGRDGANGTNLLSVGSSKGLDFASGLSGKSNNANTAGLTVGNAAKTGANGTNLLSVGSSKGLDFASGLSGKTTNANTAGVSIANAGKTGAGSINMNATGSNFGLGFANGMSDKSTMDKVTSAAKSLAKAAKEKVQNWLDMHSPSRSMMKDGGHFGEGFALGIIDKIKRVSDGAKSLAMAAKDTVNKFLDGFEVPEQDNEIHFKAVVDYDSIDQSKFGAIDPIRVKPDTSLTSSLATAVRSTRYQKGTNKDVNNGKTTENKEPSSKQPAVIQIVTPEKREFARWLVDDITEFQDFKMATIDQF